MFRKKVSRLKLCPTLISISSSLLLTLISLPTASSEEPATGVTVNCYRCRSRNFTDIGCHDPFLRDRVPLIETCKVALAGTNILVPANYCIKVVGVSELTGEEFIIRDCVLDKVEDECFPVQVEGDVIRRCTWTCGYDGCNEATGHIARNLRQAFLSFSIPILVSAFRRSQFTKLFF